MWAMPLREVALQGDVEILVLGARPVIGEVESFLGSNASLAHDRLIGDVRHAMAGFRSPGRC
jgi:hypothetical protein